MAIATRRLQTAHTVPFGERVWPDECVGGWEWGHTKYVAWSFSQTYEHWFANLAVNVVPF